MCVLVLPLQTKAESSGHRGQLIPSCEIFSSGIGGRSRGNSVGHLRQAVMAYSSRDSHTLASLPELFPPWGKTSGGQQAPRDNGIFAASTDQDLELRIEVQEIHNSRSVVESSDRLYCTLRHVILRCMVMKSSQPSIWTVKPFADHGVK